jgi:hypothetical protein
MGVHADGSGAYWTETSPDADQPHGLAYREFQDLRVGVRKRLQQEHVTFADATVGGTHKPGGTACLGIEWTNSDVSGSFVQDGTYRGRGIAWGWDASQGAALYCSTADGTGVGAWRTIALNPAKIWDDSIVWPNKEQQFTGIASFKGAVDISDNLCVSGKINAIDISMDGALYVDATMDVSGSIQVSGCVGFYGGKFRVDATTIHFVQIAPGDPFQIYMDMSINNTMSINDDISFKAASGHGVQLNETNVYDSSPFAIVKGTNYLKSHGWTLTDFNVSPVVICCSFTDNSTANTCSNKWKTVSNYYSGTNDGITLEISQANYEVRTGAQNISAGLNSLGSYNAFTAGWARVILYKLGA